MESWIKDLNYILMPSRYPVKGYESEYLAAYACWRAAWEKFRLEIGIEKPLACDGFLIPHEMGALFYKKECIGLSAYTYGSLEKGPIGHHSWWDGWTPEAKNKLRAISTNVMIGSQFTVNPKFAGKGHIVRWKEIIFLYTFMRFDTSQADVMAGHLNLTRGVDNACGENFGATVLDPNYPFNYYGVQLAAQLVAYEKKNVQQMKERREIVNLCDDLWSRLTHVTEFPVINNNIIPFKKVA